MFALSHIVLKNSKLGNADFSSDFGNLKNPVPTSHPSSPVGFWQTITAISAPSYLKIFVGSKRLRKLHQPENRVFQHNMAVSGDPSHAVISFPHDPYRNFEP
jgi:hypothetical protein